jgi:hypothetical protein
VDADTWIWLVMPMVAALVTAVYMAKRDHSHHEDHEERIRKLELLEAGRSGAESVEHPQATTVDVNKMQCQVAKNTQDIGVLTERVQGLEES